MKNRMIKYSAIALICLSSIFYYSFKNKTIQSSNDREVAINNILKNINVPEFKQTTYNVLEQRAKPDGKSNCQPIINSTIKKLSKAGGGTIVFPKGEYYCEGPIHIESDIHIHFEEGAVVKFSQNPEHYLPLQLVRWEGVNCYNYSPYFYAIDKKNIAITGKGVLNGNAIGGIAEWRSKQKPDQNMLRQMGKQLKPLEERVFGEGHFLRPSFIQFMNCQNILISDITLTNVPFWVIHPTYCNNITIRNIHVNSFRINNDGIDLDSCEDVLVEDCTFRAGDDAMVIKSGRDQDAWKVGKPSKNIVVRNCFASEVLHGLAFGSEMSGGLENIYIDNFHLKKVEQYAIQFKSNLDRGGYIKNVFIDGVFIDETKTAIFFTNDYHSYSGGDSPSEFSGIEIKNVICNKASGKAIDIVGLEQKPIRSILLENIMIVEEGEKSEILNVVESEFTNIKISKRDFINKTNAEPHTVKH